MEAGDELRRGAEALYRMAGFMTRTLILLSGGHPVHRRFGESVGAISRMLEEKAAKDQSPPVMAFKLFKGSLSVPSGYDIMLCESCYHYPAIKRRLGLLGDTKIINMNCGPLPYHLLSSRIKGAEKKVLLDLMKDVDGFLVYGAYGMELLERLGVKAPARIIYPFISEASMGRFASVKPALGSNNITIVATSDPHNKGLDLLFLAMKKVSERYPDARLKIVTRLGEAEIASVEGYDPARITILRDVPDMAEVFRSCALYVQPSRGDMFPVSALEALASGVPNIVSIENGAKDVVAKIDPGMVVPLDEERIAEAIIAYLDLPIGGKKALSDKSRHAAMFFNERDMLALFKRQFDSLTKEIMQAGA
ncbi:MAG: glycosyltransferase family 4 protein [Candidatus Micrarchaeota archaeon]